MNNLASSSSGGIFSGSQHFIVAGGTFVVTDNYTAAPAKPTPNDFRMIRLGDIDLQHEIAFDNIVDGQHEGRRVRRVYSAKVGKRKSRMTLAIYQGGGAEELAEMAERYITAIAASVRWQYFFAMSMNPPFRHPNLLQIYGVTTSSGIYAAIFYDDLIPYEHFLDLYGNSPILTAYIKAYCELDRGVYKFRPAVSMINADHLSGSMRLSLPRFTKVIGDTATLDAYFGSGGQPAVFALMSQPVSYPASCTRNQLDAYVEIAVLPDAQVDVGDWNGAEGEVMQDGWTRCNSSNVYGNTLRLYCWSQAWKSKFWLRQANYIFSCLEIASDFEDYLSVDFVEFSIDILANEKNPPPGFLFLCPAQDLGRGRCPFSWPECAAYWALDPLGIERLSTGDATALGFPSFEASLSLMAYSWDSTIYTALRQFHQRKGFDPDSQQVSPHLGYPLYQLPCRTDAPLTQADEADSHNAQDQARFMDEDSEERPEYSSSADNSCRDSEHEEVSTSRALNFIIIVQLTLIFFLSSSALYEQVWTSHEET
ncbi:hypothetical protein MVEN_02201700 [Mycena venus]|uniref:Uncharacterized protein n=1 Tax=Mycena venus TaxID=2733690 RepID=A0A8H6X7D1_9AGAR|nr:hypothetical protein MVEN_02201700 [Mycena venus]